MTPTISHLQYSAEIHFQAYLHSDDLNSSHNGRVGQCLTEVSPVNPGDRNDSHVFAHLVLFSWLCADRQDDRSKSKTHGGKSKLKKYQLYCFSSVEETSVLALRQMVSFFYCCNHLICKTHHFSFIRELKNSMILGI